MLLDRGIQGCPRVCYSVVDVRDVASAYVKALTLENVAGKWPHVALVFSYSFFFILGFFHHYLFHWVYVVLIFIVKKLSDLHDD